MCIARWKIVKVEKVLLYFYVGNYDFGPAAFVFSRFGSWMLLLSFVDLGHDISCFPRLQ